jgi:hypothetical protein
MSDDGTATATSGIRRRDGRSPTDHATEFRDLVVGYARQETLDPLRNLGRYTGFGALGALLIGTGCLLLLLALLRGLQSIDALNDVADVDGSAWSWVPYLATMVAGGVMIGLAAWGIGRSTSRAREE